MRCLRFQPCTVRIALVVSSLVVVMHLCATRHGLASALASRKDAFIGYREQIMACADTLPTCLKKARANHCLSDPWIMRRFCPLACNVDRCTAPGATQVTTC